MTLQLLHSHFFIFEENMIFFFISILYHEKGGRGRILERHFQGPPLSMALEMDGGGGRGGDNSTNCIYFVPLTPRHTLPRVELRYV
jgi:hypothetical protein